MRSRFTPLWKLHRSVEVLRCMRETDQWMRLSAAYLGVRELKYPCELQLHGLEPVVLREKTDLWAFWQIFLRRVYEVTGTEKVIVDAGANVGFFTLWAARRAPQARILSIEPVPETQERLRENVRRNGLDGRVTCIQCALGGMAELRMVKVGLAKSQARRVLAYDPGAGAAVAPVQTKTLTQVFDEHQIASLDLLKMDIEGGEYETLLSTPVAVLKRIQRIALEYHADVPGYTTGQLLEYLREAGFEVKKDMHNSEGYGVALLENSAASALGTGVPALATAQPVA